MITNQERLKKEAHLKIVKILKETTETSGDLQINHTPPEICKEMLDKVDLESAKNVLVLFNVELIYELRLRGYAGEVYYFTQSEKEVQMAKKLMPDVKVKYIEKEKDPFEHMSTWPEKFDIIVANPPYGGTDVQNLHIKFLDKSIEISERERGQIVFVHPSTQFINKRTGDSVNKKIEEFISSLNFFNGGSVFGIEKHIPISITHIDFSKKSKGFKVINEISGREAYLKKIDDINLFNEYYYIPNIEKKIKNFMTRENVRSCESSVIFKGKRSKGNMISPLSPYVRIQVFQGSVDNSSRNKLWKNNFFVLTTKNQIAELPGDSDPTLWIEFSTIKEAENCITYFKTYFARFCLSLVKTDKNLRSKLHMVPKMDFTKEWTDEKLYITFGITEEEQAFIREVIPPYYD